MDMSSLKEEKAPKKKSADVVSVRFVLSSAAGAGSSDFHIYRKFRRHEMLRNEVMDAEEDEKIKEETYLKRRAELQKKDEERMSKNRAKRLKKKQAKEKAKKRKLNPEESPKKSDEPVVLGDAPKLQEPTITIVEEEKPSALPQNVVIIDDTLQSKEEVDQHVADDLREQEEIKKKLQAFLKTS